MIIQNIPETVKLLKEQVIHLKTNTTDQEYFFKILEKLFARVFGENVTCLVEPPPEGNLERWASKGDASWIADAALKDKDTVLEFLKAEKVYTIQFPQCSLFFYWIYFLRIACVKLDAFWVTFARKKE